MGLFAVVFSGFGLALLAPWIVPRTGRATGWVLGLLPAAITGYLATYVGAVAAGDTVQVGVAWVPGLNVEMAFYLDGLSLFFALLVTGIGTLIFVYAGGYLKGHHHLGRFFAYLSMFMAAMIGLVLADNLFTFYIFFELTSFASFVLIGFNHDEAPSRRAAWQALLVTKAGGLALLVGFLLMEQVTGTLQISTLLTTGDALRDSAFYVPILLLVLAGAFTKSAQFPFYFWLPNAMQAPTPVSAYLHSATMVKAGIYVLARFHPVLSGTTLWMVLVGGVGAATMLLSAWLALQYTDMKGILAYTTIMALGLLTMLLGLGTETAVKACMVFVLVHAFYKAALFMVAGAVDHELHVRDVTKLRGLKAKMPFTAAAAGIAALSMAGIPPFFGFIGKELIYEATLHYAPAVVAVTAVSVLANVALVASAGLLAVRPFFGSLNAITKTAHRPSVGLWFGPVVLAVLSLGLGLAPWLLDASFLGPSVGAVLGASVTPHLALWHGFNLELALSALTLAAGVGTYFGWNALHTSAPGRAFERWLGTGLDNGYDHVVNGLMAFGAWQTGLLQNGRLRNYIATILTTFLVLVGYAAVHTGALTLSPSVAGIAFHEWVLAFLVLGGATATMFFHSRLAMVISLGVSGFSIALLYLAYSAPDLAMTQFLIETLTVILFVLILATMPLVREQISSGTAVRDGAIALGVGGTVTALILAVLHVPFSNPMGAYYSENSYVEAEGQNIVNTILVDFRALDTLGEITVLLIAGLGVFAMLRLGRALTPEELGGSDSESPVEAETASSSSSEPAEQVS
ncbi:MAG: putative monovalent cation/H+ antiporter subunit A [Salinibacter sp.]